MGSEGCKSLSDALSSFVNLKYFKFKIKENRIGIEGLKFIS